MDWNRIAERITVATGDPFVVEACAAVGGGCINETVRLSGKDGREFFIKLNRASRMEMFAAEAEGLREIRESETVRAPEPICLGVSGESAWLVLEYLPLKGATASAPLGSALARMHRRTAEAFGWTRNNTIGSTPQINSLSSDWIVFWREHRLGSQLRLAERKGYSGRLLEQGERLLESFPGLFTTYQPEPSLLHGDLWSGNQAVLPSGEPVIFDPAVYYGDREAEIAMTELFGGFSREFYAAYEEVWPLDEGYGVRRDLYNLYHILNHLNLFGGGYLRQAERMMQRLLSELH